MFSHVHELKHKKGVELRRQRNGKKIGAKCEELTLVNTHTHSLSLSPLWECTNIVGEGGAHSAVAPKPERARAH